jgi:hypothetical protein
MNGRLFLRGLLSLLNAESDFGFDIILNRASSAKESGPQFDII